MALTDTIQCDGSTTSFTLARAVTTKESLSLTIASGASAGLVVSPSDYTFSPVNSVSQSVTITWANAANYGTVGTPVDVTVAIYHNPGADPADTLLYSYDSATAMRPEMIGRDLEHVIDLIKMVIGTADLATTDLGVQEDAIDAVEVRVTAAEATIVTHTSEIAAHEVRLDAAEPTIATHTSQLAATTSSGLKDSITALAALINTGVGLPAPALSGIAKAADSGTPLYVLASDQAGVVEWVDLRSQILPLLSTRVVHTVGLASASPVQLTSGAYVDVSATLTLPVIVDSPEIWSVFAFLECDSSQDATPYPQGTFVISESGAAAAAAINASGIIELSSGYDRGAMAVCSYQQECAVGETVTFKVRGARTDGNGTNTIDVYKATLIAVRVS